MSLSEARRLFPAVVACNLRLKCSGQKNLPETKKEQGQQIYVDVFKFGHFIPAPKNYLPPQFSNSDHMTPPMTLWLAGKFNNKKKTSEYPAAEAYNKHFVSLHTIQISPHTYLWGQQQQQPSNSAHL